MVGGMMKRIVLLLCLAITILLSSCDKGVSGPRFGDDTYSISALLLSGKPIDAENPVYISKSSTIDDFDFAQIFVPDAAVKIMEMNGETIVTTLNLVPMLDFSEDIPKVKYIDNSGYIVKADTRYRLEAEIPGYEKLVWAETLVPGEVGLVTDFLNQNIEGEGYSLNPAQMDSIPFDRMDVRYPLALSTGAYTGKINLFVEIYCLEEFSTDLEWTIPIFGITNADSSLAWIYNSSGDSMRRITLVAQYLAKYFASANGNYAVLNSFRQAVAFFGRYRFTVYSVDDNFYRYRYTAEGYLNGGVHNALGFFGSASGGKLYAKVIKGDAPD